MSIFPPRWRVFQKAVILVVSAFSLVLLVACVIAFTRNSRVMKLDVVKMQETRQVADLEARKK